ncbi:UDP-N-acetylmuramoyl-tripeptide--D-alanyl-D-alanine ligase [Mariniphaga anaerophila]|uniref:Alanine racemase n=1 Tax=Mariniphaga anaerophila TaxID=1484053 RepID=A0A1M4VQN9_9BACT|nr:bifunctional UDP-N-acetylmuramoyl-tripeptide:D-alanyl-D-alanine ligase/alanine racemase [Mariniphaga anaerophila]SHE71279.1 UDP-N-acetylmuramoyl-tripeptide--D-alanyl-D-alanine ligase [Mariniphaga anaerophila]
MTKLSIKEAAEIVHGKLFLPDAFSALKIKHIVTDSRTFFGDDDNLFFALKGPRNNGHEYITELQNRGIKAFVVSESEVVSGKAAFILVKDTTKALQKLAAHNRAGFHYPVVGITGSNGKTIVKEWLYELLSEEFRIVHSPKSYNSQVGVPLSVLLMENNYTLGIFEAGISQPGEMDKLAPVISPEVGILTNIGDAHQENFQSKQQKTAEKLKLFRNSKKLIFCSDDENTAGLVREFCIQYNIDPVSWSMKNRDAFACFSKTAENGTTRLKASVNGESAEFDVPFTDDSSIENVCHCFAAVWTLSKHPEKILPRFSQLAPVAMRLEIKRGINNCLLINDYYNSDLASLSIALSVLHHQAQKSHLKKVVVLSDIRQTGLPSGELYRQVNQLLEQWKVSQLIGVGKEISAHPELFSAEKKFFLSTKAFEKSFMRNDFKNSAVLIKGARTFTFEKISDLLQKKAHQTVLEINLNALINNLNVFRSRLNPATKITAMVKAFSYGSGDVEIAKLLQFQNVDYLAVAVADEGVDLRQAGVQTPVVVMNPEKHSFQNMIDFRLEPNIYSKDLMKAFEKAVAENALTAFPVHIKLDTGMNRLGFKTAEEVEEVVAFLQKTDRLKVASTFSHLAACDDPQMDAFTQQQFSRFEMLSRIITEGFPYKIIRHILNSAGIERFPEKQFEMARLGIGLYGISLTNLPLQTISTFKSIISQVKKLKPGETVGYNCRGKITSDAEIAIVPVGYADGMDRKLGNGNGEAFVKGKRVPVIGNICMDMLMLDVTGLEVQPGNEVEFFGQNISILEVAEKVGTIPYEILTGISQRVKRIYIHE